MRSIQITIAILMLAVHANAQDYTDFDIVKSSQREVVYGANFDYVDNNNKWIGYNHTDAEAEKIIHDGFYSIRTHISADSEIISILELALDYYRDFEIEFKVQLKYDDKYLKQYSTLYWGADSSSEHVNGHAIEFYPSGCYSFCYKSRINGSNVYPDKIRCKGAYINFNTYTVRKFKNNYYVFINKKYNHSYTYTQLQGHGLLLTVSGQSNLDMDYIQVSYLKMQ